MGAELGLGDSVEAEVPGCSSAGSHTTPRVPRCLDDESPLVGTIEWWDEGFLPKDRRDAHRKGSRLLGLGSGLGLMSKADAFALTDGPPSAASSSSSSSMAESKVGDDELGAVPMSLTGPGLAGDEDFLLLSLQHCKTYRFVQHPPVVRPLGGERPDVPLPMYLTKKEQRRLRKSKRMERELEKRDKQMMGLIPAPEPKLKLSNYMKVLGDQAVADPSKIEMRVQQQVG